MKLHLKAALLLGTAGTMLLSSVAAASDRTRIDSAAAWRPSASPADALTLSMAMNFGSPAGTRSGHDLGLRLHYGDNHSQPGRWTAPALFEARRSAGQWTSMKVSGVEVLHLRQRMQADGDDANTAGWIIGGLVGVGAVAIIARQLSNDGQESFDINRGLGGNN